MNLIKPEHVAHIIDNKNGTCTVFMVNGFKQVMKTPEANELAKAVTQINKLRDQFNLQHGNMLGSEK